MLAYTLACLGVIFAHITPKRRVETVMFIMVKKGGIVYTLFKEYTSNRIRDDPSMLAYIPRWPEKKQQATVRLPTVRDRLQVRKKSLGFRGNKKGPFSVSHGVIRPVFLVFCVLSIVILTWSMLHNVVCRLYLRWKAPVLSSSPPHGLGLKLSTTCQC